MKMVTKKFLSPADWFEAQTLYVYELSEVVMAGKYKDFMLGAL